MDYKLSTKNSIKIKVKMVEQTFTNVERSHSANVPVIYRFLFKYKTFGEDYSVEVEEEDLNKAMKRFAKYYHHIEEVYSIVKILS